MGVDRRKATNRNIAPKEKAGSVSSSGGNQGKSDLERTEKTIGGGQKIEVKTKATKILVG